MSYESDILRDWYLLFHFGSANEILEGVAIDPEGLPEGCLEFPVKTVEIAKHGNESGRVLDLGCAVGRSSFEFSRIAGEVVGIDFSQSFIDAANAIASHEAVPYRRFREMHLWDDLVARLPEGSNPERISFRQGDAMSLPRDLGTFDLIHAANLLCRLPEPKRFLEAIPRLIRDGGSLVFATPATWMEEYTPRANQPEGLTLDYLKGELSEQFDLAEVTELPFLIREHQRKLQLSTSQTSVWTKKS
ncbi:MAG: putative 4-mercaptohistidine N1-methyltransferase [Verrucomicrobiota bacterium]